MKLKIKDHSSQQLVDISEAKEILIDITDNSCIWISITKENKIIYKIQIEDNKDKNNFR